VRRATATPTSAPWPRRSARSATRAICPPRPSPGPTPARRRRWRSTVSALVSDKTMLNHGLIHPKILEVLGRAGHHAKVLIADGNYPASSTLGPNAELVSLNLMPGVVTCTQVLEALLSALPIEEANTMGIPTDDPYAL